MRHLIGAAAILPLLGAAPLAGQAVLNWPLVLEARPAPLVTGAGSVLGNPAGLGELPRRAEGLVSDLETPDEMGLRGLTVAGAVRIVDNVTLGAAYRHLGVGDMLHTDGPPVGGAARPIEIGEDIFALGVGARLGALSAGVAARLDTPAQELGGRESWAGTLGAGFTPSLPFGASLRAAAMVVVDREIDAPALFEWSRDDLALAGAAELRAPALLERRLQLAVAWGAHRDTPLGVAHRVVASGTWARMFEMQAGASAEPGSGESTWVPVFAALMNLGRYQLGIVREHLPNDFGAAMHYRLSVAL